MQVNLLELRGHPYFKSNYLSYNSLSNALSNYLLSKRPVKNLFCSWQAPQLSRDEVKEEKKNAYPLLMNIFSSNIQRCYVVHSNSEVCHEGPKPGKD